ncbi:hypothetical protein [Sphaerisporangium sp. NPDC051011]|uniref:hypothetical protein n=1 Tax=Sphaerisporangium sp. NPDC051011 TaxID=3155792 RepID=UPI0033F1DFD9
MDTRVGQVRDLLHEAAEVHHRVYEITDGVDPDWASWYADWLIRLSDLPSLLGTTPVPSELIYEFVGLDKAYGREAPGEPWESYYARRLLTAFRDGTPAS